MHMSTTRKHTHAPSQTKSPQGLGLAKRVEAVKGTRTIGKKDMRLNDALPTIKVRPCVHAYIMVIWCRLGGVWVRGIGIESSTYTNTSSQIPNNKQTISNQVDPETYRVTADGEHLTCEPLKELPLAQRFFVF